MKEFLEKDNYILCPICKKEKFYPDDYFIFCNHCGWEGNLNVDDNIIELNGYSARDYRKVYQEYLKEHPNYIWKDDTEALEKYMKTFNDYGYDCPVCGEKDVFNPDCRYCYKCGWKYNFVQAQYPDFDDSSNKLSLDDYKEKYNIIIKKNPNYQWKNTEEVKMPFTNEQMEWLKNNDIRTDFDKLTPDEEMHQIYDEIEKKQKQYENKDGYEMYMFIGEILGAILDSI